MCGVQFFVNKWKLLAYNQEDLRVPQVGNPWLSGLNNWFYVVITIFAQHLNICSSKLVE